MVIASMSTLARSGSVAGPISVSVPQINLVNCRRVCMAKDNEGRQKGEITDATKVTILLPELQTCM